MNRSTLNLCLATFAFGLSVSGCSLEKKDDVGVYREAIPEADAVAVDGPETTQGESSTRSGGAGLLQAAPGTSGNWAQWYAWTREVRDGVNAVTASVLGSVWYIVNTEPTEVGEDEAVWGPYTDALEPASWRFRVQRVAENEYDYFLEGRPKQSTSDADFKVVLTGKGYGKQSDQHGDGYFVVDLDVARELDPLKHQNDSGTVKITHDLPADIGTRLNALPRVIKAEITPAGEQWVAITSTANEDGTGKIEAGAFVDIDASKTTAPEDVDIVSRWQTSGAGRADITIANGDLPASIGMVQAVECWGTDFTRVYYGDTVNFAPTEGDMSACAYDSPPGG